MASSHSYSSENRNNLLWYSVSEAEFEQNRPLRSPLSQEELVHRILAADPAPHLRKDADVFGIQLKQETVFKIQLLESLLRYVPNTKERAEAILHGNPDWRWPVKEYFQHHFSSTHHNVISILQDSTIFPEGTGPQLAYLSARFHVNASAYTHYGMDFWKPNDLNLIIEALHSFPEDFFESQTEPVNILRFERGAGPLKIVNGDSGIWIYDPWETQSDSAKIISFVHELSHVVGNRLGSGELHHWKTLAGWTFDSVRNKYALMQPNAAVSLYGERSPDEDLAESIVAYRFCPQLIKEKSPKKYEFLKTAVFKNREYVPGAPEVAKNN